MVTRLFGGLMISAVLMVAFSSVGCNQPAKNDDGKKQAKNTDDQKKDDGKKEIPKGSAHEGWWCQEHGVPEHICSLCLPEAEVKKMFKDTGDWCKIHDRAQSQCFKCDPSKYKKFEDMYVAKFNKKPERPPEDEFKK
jgi:hypothetical protein